MLTMARLPDGQGSVVPVKLPEHNGFLDPVDTLCKGNSRNQDKRRQNKYFIILSFFHGVVNLAYPANHDPVTRKFPET